MMAQPLRIAALCIAAAVLYGIAHDQVTARISIEYFTIGHPRVLSTDDPTPIGLYWGVVATWWVGALLAIPMTFAARAGTRPKRTARSLISPIARLLVVMAACAAIAAWIGNSLAKRGTFVLLEPFASSVPADRHVPFITALWAHLASYGVGFFGGLVTAWRVWRSRAI